MARQSWIWDRQSGELVSRDEYARLQAERRDAHRSTIHDTKMVERGSWVYDRASGEIITLAEYHQRHAAARHGSGPMVISDYLGGGVSGMWHPAEGRHTDSKSEFRQWTKAHGCVEVGNEPLRNGAPERLSKAERAAEIKRAMGAL